MEKTQSKLSSIRKIHHTVHLFFCHNSWGRVLCAVGYASPLSNPINPDTISVSFVPSDGSEPLKLLVNGEPEQVDEVRAKEILEKEDLEIKVSLGSEGKESAQYYTCDLSHVSLFHTVTANFTLNHFLTSQEYVTINGDYRS